MLDGATPGHPAHLVRGNKQQEHWSIHALLEIPQEPESLTLGHG